MTSVDTITLWREDWSSVSVVNHTIVTDPTIDWHMTSVLHGAVLWLPVTLLVAAVIFAFELKLSCEDICVAHFLAWDIFLIANIRHVC